MLRKFMLVLCAFLSQLALAEEFSVIRCTSSSPNSEYFLISKESAEFLQSQPAGSIDDAIETFIAASEQTLVKVDIDQETGQALAQLEMPATYECGQMDFSTLGYKGINYIFSRFKVNDKNESKHHSLVIAKRPDAAKNAGNSTRLGRITTAMTIGLIATAALNSVGYGVIACIMCCYVPNKCYDLYNHINTVLTEVLTDRPNQSDQSTQTDFD